MGQICLKLIWCQPKADKISSEWQTEKIPGVASKCSDYIAEVHWLIWASAGFPCLTMNFVITFDILAMVLVLIICVAVNQDCTGCCFLLIFTMSHQRSVWYTVSEQLYLQLWGTTIWINIFKQCCKWLGSRFTVFIFKKQIDESNKHH